MEGHRRITALIPCAGRGKRFGGDKPKHLLPVEWQGIVRPMVGHVVRNLYQPLVGKVVIGVRPNDYSESMTVPVKVTPVDRSIGQADTLLQMIQPEIDESDGPCLVVNCDALVHSRDLAHLMHAVTTRPEYAMACAVMRTESPSMSYVDVVPHPVRFAEKERLSKFGMAGAWAFRSMKELDSAISVAWAKGDRHKGELYLSHALNYLQGPKLAWQIDSIVDWNTPEALVASGARIAGL